MSAMPPKRDWFIDWIAMHVEATGAKEDTVAALLALRDTGVLEAWNPTEAELYDATHRLTKTCRTPKFANEHVDAVGLELVAIRADAVRKANPAPVSDGPVSCSLCSGTGAIVVPHPQCVQHGKLVNFKFPDGSDYGRIQCIAVNCNCPRGEAETASETRRAQLAGPDDTRRKHMTYQTYQRLINDDDGLGLLKRHNEKIAADCRATSGPMNLKNLPGIAAVLAGGFRVPPKPRPSLPAKWSA